MITVNFNKYVNIKYENTNLDNIKKKLLKDNKMLGWYDLNSDYLDDIKKIGERIIKKCDVFLVIGVGGSINCSKAIIDAFKNTFKKKKTEIIYLGDNLSSDYIKDTLEYLNDKEVVVNVISKSGNTLEVNITTDLVIEYLLGKYSKEQLKNRVIITTENKDNYLTQLATKYKFKKLIFEDNVGGRFSMFSAASLLPMAIAGIDLKLFFLGANEAKDDLKDCYRYTLYRHNMYINNLVVESFNVYDPKLASFLEWLKQLFAESQGKKGYGILPISNVNTSSLHSMGQYLQDGVNMTFETNIYNHSVNNIWIDKYAKTLDEINYIALKSVSKAHFEANKNAIIIEMDKIDELNLGYLAFFFMMSAALGSYLLNINYYDQDGVNNYKNNIYEELK